MSKKNIFIGLIILIALVGFLNKNYIISHLPGKFFGAENFKEKTLKISLEKSATDLSSNVIDANNLTRTANIYESLVSFDNDLKIMSSLAFYWKNVDDLTWEFKLRKEIYFHDKQLFDANSVKNSFDVAKKQGSEELKDVLSTIQEIKIKDPYLIEIKTKKADPLLLKKLTKFYIGRPGNIGTGPYKIKKWEKGKSLSLTAFLDYWSSLPKYKDVEFLILKDINQQKEQFKKKNIDIIANASVEQIEQMDIVSPGSGRMVPKLGSIFLMFNLNDATFSKKSTRESVVKLINPMEIEMHISPFAQHTSKYIPPHIINALNEQQLLEPEPEPKPNFEHRESGEIKNIFGEKIVKINFDYPSAYSKAMPYIIDQLSGAGFEVTENPTTNEKLLDKIKNNQSQLFLIGWQPIYADVQSFLDNFIHSKGKFNSGFKNDEIDKAIETIRHEMNSGTRLKAINKVMDQVYSNMIGMPLVETTTAHAVQKNIMWDPGPNGLFLIKDIK